MQLSERTQGGTFWLVVSDPLETSEVTSHRMTVDVSAEVWEWLRSMATYRNQLAQLQAKRLRRQWTSKAIAESLLAAAIDGVKAQMAELFERLGPVPSADDEKAVEAYAKKVLAWDSRLESEKKAKK